jgi:hypothetical protein
MDRYDFMSIVDDIFKECETTEEVAIRYVQMKKDLDSIYVQNVALRHAEIKSES